MDEQMHLAYSLELPEHPADIQRAFRIAPEASFALSVKTPEASAPPGVGLRDEQKADFPKKLQAGFRDRRFEREDVKLLDYPGAEFILVGARSNPEKAYGIELPAEGRSAGSDSLPSCHRFLSQATRPP